MIKISKEWVKMQKLILILFLLFFNSHVFAENSSTYNLLNDFLNATHFCLMIQELELKEDDGVETIKQKIEAQNDL
ncbi:MAG: hypothetical protein WCH62_03285, partial [Candidatus Omnitrophota bacterium]